MAPDESAGAPGGRVSSPLRRPAILVGVGTVIASAWGLTLPVLGLSGWAPGRASPTMDLVAGVPPAIAGALFIWSAAMGWRRLKDVAQTDRWATGALLVVAAVMGIVLMAIAAAVLVVSAIH